MTKVAVALLERDAMLLICQRRQDQTHAGKWEFPGGKVEPGEKAGEALARELREELGIEIALPEERVRYGFAYHGKPRLCLVFFRVRSFRGEIDSSQFAETRWESRASLPGYDFLEGDERIVRELADGRH